MYKLIIHGSPVAPYFQVGVFKNTELKAKKQTNFDNLHLVVLDYIIEYSITEVDLIGSKAYMQGVQQQIEKASNTHFDINNLKFNYVK